MMIAFNKWCRKWVRVDVIDYKCVVSENTMAKANGINEAPVFLCITFISFIMLLIISSLFFLLVSWN